MPIAASVSAVRREQRQQERHEARLRQRRRRHIAPSSGCRRPAGCDRSRGSRRAPDRPAASGLPSVLTTSVMPRGAERMCAGQLRVREVHLRARLFDHGVVAHGADDADDGQPGLVVGAHHELPADRVLTGPVARRHRVVDHDRGHRVFAIGVGQEPAANQRQAHRFEVAGRDRLEVAVRIFLGHVRDGLRS